MSENKDNPMMEHECRTISKVIIAKGRPLFDITATTVTIVDRAAGEYLVIKQDLDTDDYGVNAIHIDKTEWPMIRATIDEMMVECRD